MLVIDCIGIAVAANLTVSNSQCEVCIGEEGHLLVVRHQRAHIGSVVLRNRRRVAHIAVATLREVAALDQLGNEAIHRVVLHNRGQVRGIRRQRRELFGRGQLALVEQIIDKVIGRGETCHLALHRLGNILCVNIFDKRCNQLLSYLAVDLGNIVLVECRHRFIVGCGLALRNHTGQLRQLDSRNRLGKILGTPIGIAQLVVCRIHLLHQTLILGLLLGPRRKFLLVGALLLDRAQALQTENLALPLLPRIGDVGVLGCVLDTHLRVGLLSLRDHIQTQGAELDLHRIRQTLDVVGSRRNHIALGVAGEAVDHREIALLDTLGRDLEVATRLIGYILARVVGGLVVLAGIDAENREVARVARPDPVVGVAAELTDRRGGRAYQTNVGKLLIDKQKILIGVVQRLDRSRIATALRSLLLDSLDVGCDLLVALGLHALGNILHTHQNRNIEVGIGQLLLARHCPKTVGQVVVLDATVALDRAIAAVVVGQQQTRIRHQLARATAIEQHHGVLHRRAIDAVNILGRQSKTLRTHILDAVANQARKPHTLVSRRREDEHQSHESR